MAGRYTLLYKLLQFIGFPFPFGKTRFISLSGQWLFHSANWLSIWGDQAHKKYPYLLTNLVIDHPDQVWCADIRISMGGRGRDFDNIFVERLWRSVKYEEVYLHQYQTVSEARNGLAKYFLFYNMERFHESLGYQTPYETYVKDRVKINPMQASTIHHIQPYFLS